MAKRGMIALQRSQAGRLAARSTGVIDRLNGPWHRRALQIFLAITLAHWTEHLLQAYQLWVLDWPRSHACRS